MKNKNITLWFVSALLLLLCVSASAVPPHSTVYKDNATQASGAQTNENQETKPLTKDDVKIELSLLFDKYTLDDRYTYQQQQRDFNWEQIRSVLAHVENMQNDTRPWILLQNYKNLNGEAPLVKKFARNRYRRVADTLGVERYQSVPLYAPGDTVTPIIYGRDGTIAHLAGETKKFYRICSPTDQREWYVPKRYVKRLADTTRFDHVVVIDRKDQNIATLERAAKGKWLIRSKNPATTGRNKPPYSQPTPLGIFLLQQQKRKMVYLKDGSKENGGFAPYASRFTCGAYIHGVPVNAPNTREVEYSWSLGTTPRSHMCVRNATSHSKFIYEWAPLRQTLVIVVE